MWGCVLCASGWQASAAETCGWKEIDGPRTFLDLLCSPFYLCTCSLCAAAPGWFSRSAWPRGLQLFFSRVQPHYFEGDSLWWRDYTCTDFISCCFSFSLFVLHKQTFSGNMDLMFKNRPERNICMTKYDKVFGASSIFYYLTVNSQYVNRIWWPLHPRNMFLFNVGQPLFCTRAFCRHTCRIYLQNKTGRIMFLNHEGIRA